MDAAGVTTVRQLDLFGSRPYLAHIVETIFAVLAAGDQAHDGGGHVAADNRRFDDIGLLAVIGGIGTLGIHDAQ